ncbi:sulfatase-like hydrolase/transferase [Romboutsia sedimentorum]|uniref:Sulfatase-like hydrolase/transferase n=1 Tax=Romboutsia sedimentorum TaxID=1368474 RepID=A0ABT7E6Y5_9FIRM|nr:sulfatase-like hydrolase/transferase [Romboutsia sedimentorum]MDK2562689.1 sulfatase-like hydrolase/transferase [Romboutsia sedimentorum]
MSILNDKLNHIISHSKINFYENEIIKDLRDRKINVNIAEEINYIWNKIDKKSRVAIYGAGNHTMKLFEIVNRNDKNIVCIVDNLKPEGKFLGYPLINKEKMKDYNLDVVFISTLGYAEEIKQEVNETFSNINVIDIYETLQKLGYDTNKPFYYNRDSEVYTSIYEIKNIYKKSKSEKYLSNLIYRYLNAKDFLNSYKYIEEYVEKEYVQSELFKLLCEKLNRLISDIKISIEKQQKKNGLILLIDALRWKDIYKIDNMKFIKDISKKGINCNKAYTHVPYTSMSILSMITEKKLLDDNLINEQFPIQNQGILAKINELDYRFKYYGNQVQFFTKEFCNQSNNNNIAQLLWDYVCDTYENSQNISIIHIMEAHSPYIAGNHKDRPVDFEPYASRNLTKNEILIKKQQRGEVLEYVDEQLKYYFDFIDKKTSLIITSDHGNILEYDLNNKNDNFYIEDLINIPYIILDDSISPKKEERLVSHLDTSKIICNLIQQNKPFQAIEKREFVEINRDFTYSKFHIKKLSGMKKLHLGRAFKCFSTKTEKYIMHYDGTEEFYILPNEDQNFINDIKYKQRIEEIKKKINNKLPNFNEERFKYAREIFKIESSY